MSAGDLQTQRPPFGDASLVWCPTCQGWAKPHSHTHRPPPQPDHDHVGNLLAENAQLRARVAELEAELDRAHAHLHLAGVDLGDYDQPEPVRGPLSTVVDGPQWRAPGW